MSPDARTRILDATVEAATIHGLVRLSITDIAQRAGVSRVTLYRYFSSKDDLVAASVLREATAIIDAALAAAAPLDRPAEALEAGILATLTALRAHPLLDRLIRTEPESLTPLLIADGGPVVGLVRSAISGLVESKLGALDDVTARRLSDIIGRLLISFALITPDDPPEIVAASVASFLVDGVVNQVDRHPKGPS